MYRLGFDAKRLFNNFTGLGNYSRTLLFNLGQYFPDNAYFLYTPKVKKNSETHYFLTSPSYSVKMPKLMPKAYWRTVGITPQLKQQKIQLYHGLSHEIPMGLEKANIPSVVTIHDLLYKHFPDQYAWADRQIYDFKFRYACQHANKIVAISEATKKDIIHFFDVPAEKIEVIYQTCHDRFMQERSKKTLAEVKAKYHLPDAFLFYVGSVIERKNLLGLVKALDLLPKDLQLPLVVVGSRSEYQIQVSEYAKKANLEDKIIYIEPTFHDLSALYQQAKVFIYPSFAEGFGIPVLEALFSKTPVVTSNCSSLPEAAGPGAYLADPHAPEDIAAGIEKILTDDDYRETLIKEGFEYAQQFQGEPLVYQMMELYEKVLKRKF
ncbi:MAG: glycosyltransferase family 1 protein [Saprospiraceae bacterium]